MIEIDQLSVRIGSFRLADISLSLAQGRTLVILGPSGAGKTLLLESIMGVHRAETGRVRIDGVEVSSLPPEDRRISYIPQDGGLFPHLGVRDNILFGLRAQRRSGRECAARLDAIVPSLGLGPLLGRRDVMSLSGGERQRVALARALIVAPRVLFLDEPFSALDRVTRLEAVATLRAIKTERETTIVHVTHDLEEASAIADALAILIGGRLVQQGARDDVLGFPSSRAVAELLLVKNLLPVDALTLVSAAPRRRRPRWHAIRPEEIVLLEAADGRPNCFSARVLDAVLLASRWAIELALAGPRGDVRVEASLQPGRFRLLKPEPGRVLVAHLPPEAVLHLDE